MHTVNSPTGARRTHAAPAVIAAGLNQLGAPLTRSMDSLFGTIGRLDRLIDDMDDCGSGSAPATGWRQELRCARHQLDDLLLGHDRMRELLDNLRDLMDPQATPHEAVDLNRCLSRVAYVVRAVVSVRLRIERRAATVPTIAGSAPALTQALVIVVAQAARSIHSRGWVALASQADGGRVSITVEAQADTPACPVPPVSGEPCDGAWQAAVAVLQDHGARVAWQAGPQSPWCLRIDWPAPAGLLD